MSSTYSSLKFELIATGEQSGTWGVTTDNNIGTAIEQAIVGMATLTAADFTANVATLTLTNTNAAQNARALCLNIAAGAVSAAGTINVPAIQKPYIIINGSSYTVTVKVSGLTGVAVPTGKRTVVYNTGTDVEDQISFLSSLTLLTALPAASGGTGQSSYAVGDLLYASTTTALSKLADVATGNALISGGVGVAPSWGKINLTTHVSGTLPTTNGGTGLTSFTANGVVYASSSSALATGSALTFDGTTLTSGASGTATKLVLQGGTQTSMSIKSSTGTSGFLLGRGFASDDANTFFLYDSATNQNRFYIDSTPSIYQYATAFAWSNAANSTEYMRLTSTGLGIGTSSPAAKLQVTSSTAGDGIRITGNNFAGMNYYGSSVNTSGVFTGLDSGGGFVTNVRDSGYLAWSTTNTERMRIDSSGNVGIGTSSPITAGARLSIKAVGDYAAGLVIGSNASAANWARLDFKNTNAASPAILYQDQSGQFTIRTDAAYPITFETNATERMRIDSSGNVGIGTSSPSTKLHVYGAGTTSSSYTNGDATGATLFLQDSGGSSGNGGQLLFGSVQGIFAGIKGFVTDGTGPAGDLLFQTRGSSGNVNERMRINSVGNVGIGTISPSQKLTVVGSIASASATQSVFYLLNAAQTTGFLVGRSLGSLDTQDFFIYDATAGASRLTISSAGVVAMPAYGAGAATFSAAGVISSVSDETWKTKDGVPVDPDAMLKKLEPGYWYYNNEKKETFGADRQLGFYAQNVNAAIGPEAAPEPEEGKPWGYYDRSVLAVVVMSLQKALNTIESLTTRLTALEQK